MSITIVGMLYLSFGYWLVIETLQFIGKFNDLSPHAKFMLFRVSFVMLYLSLVYNFFIYLIFNGIYRENIKAIIENCCWACCRLWLKWFFKKSYWCVFNSHICLERLIVNLIDKYKLNDCWRSQLATRQTN